VITYGEIMAIKDVSANMGYQQIAGLAASTALTVPTKDVGGIQKTARIALLQAESQAIRWRDDGTAPTASVGMILNVGDAPYPYDGDLTAIRLIQVAATANLNVSYYT
jgi:hypothetical protein